MRRAPALAALLALAAASAGCGDDIHYRVASRSMEPALRPGTTIAVDPHAYDHRPPRRGDVVVVHPSPGIDGLRCGRPADAIATGAPCVHPVPGALAAEIVSRIVAGPGDRIAFRGGHAVVDGRRAREPYARGCAQEVCELPAAMRVPAGRWFVAGDNRGASADSRVWGPVGLGQIVGRVRGS